MTPQLQSQIQIQTQAQTKELKFGAKRSLKESPLTKRQQRRLIKVLIESGTPPKLAREIARQRSPATKTQNR